MNSQIAIEDQGSLEDTPDSALCFTSWCATGTTATPAQVPMEDVLCACMWLMIETLSGGT